LRYGIVADIHANLAAFEAVLQDMGPVDALWCLGDLVGYGPDPNECIELLRRHEHLCVMGNHDAATIGELDTAAFNPAAAMAAQWTTRQLTDRSIQFLSALPYELTEGPFTIVHGSPRQPIWEYITHESRAAANFGLFGTAACLVGHTHVPALFELQGDSNRVFGRVPGPGDTERIGDARFIANPGGVGQPRDGDPRAAYAVYDSEIGTLEWRRVTYPIKTTQDRMREVGLPQPLIERIAYGW
jgi:diadenosine tetraphosphatase ApaH/serine/threonine PP2A family protein phosphatase